jgi:hypothetical protein
LLVATTLAVRLVPSLSGPRSANTTWHIRPTCVAFYASGVCERPSPRPWKMIRCFHWTVRNFKSSNTTWHVRSPCLGRQASGVCVHCQKVFN